MRTLAAAALFLGAAPAFAQPTPPAAAPPAAPSDAVAAAPVVVDANFTLGVGDSVSVGMVGRTDFTAAAQQVSSEGTVALPLIGKVKALGLTLVQLTESIQDSLKKGGFYADPVVHVEVVGVASRYATVFGDVNSPGLLPLDRTYHLSEIVARVGAHTGEGGGVIVLTHADGQPKRYSIEELATGSGSGDPLVQAGDKIYVPPPASEVVYISGQVRSPGSFPLGRNMTVREAIAKGGGLTEMGSENKLKLFRKNVRQRDVKLDTVLQAGDILQIGERLF